MVILKLNYVLIIVRFIVNYKGENKDASIEGCKIFFTDVFNLRKMIAKTHSY